MKDQRRSGHSVMYAYSSHSMGDKVPLPSTRETCKKKCRELVIQICDAEDIRILKGMVSQDHVHMHIEYSPELSISNLITRVKGRSSRWLQDEFPRLKKRYWGRHFRATAYGAWSTGNITDEMVQAYLEQHRDPSNADTGNIILA